MKGTNQKEQGGNQKGPDLERIQKKIDEVLENETYESFHKWYDNRQHPSTASEPAEGENCPRDNKPCQHNCEDFCFNAGHAVLKKDVTAKPIKVEIPEIEVPRDEIRKMEEWAHNVSVLQNERGALRYGAEYGFKRGYQSALASTEAKLRDAN